MGANAARTKNMATMLMPRIESGLRKNTRITRRVSVAERPLIGFVSLKSLIANSGVEHSVQEIHDQVGYPEVQPDEQRNSHDSVEVGESSRLDGIQT